MSNFLIAAYSLTIKEIYDNIKDQIPGKLKRDSFKKNRARMVNFSIPSVKEAYIEGVAYAEAYVFGTDRKIKPKMSDKAKKEIYEVYIARIKNAEKIYKQRIANLRTLGGLVNKRIDLKNGSQELQAWNEYINAVKISTDNLIINSGAQGQDQIWQTL